MDGRVRVQPGDRWSCRGCGQLPAFDKRGHVPQEQLDGCRSLCDWSLVERRGVPVEDGPAV
jgi:hypothetical protein